MISLDVRGLTDVQAQLRQLASGQIAFATSLALNRTGFAVRKTLQDRMSTAFVSPTPLIKGANRVTPSTKESLTATVYVDPRRVSVLMPHEAGGQRGLKAFERELGLSGNWRAVPTDNVQVNAYGNIPQATIKQIVTALKRRSAYFAVMPGQRSHLRPGIYQRAGLGLVTLFLFKPVVLYRQRLEWERTAMDEARRVLPVEAANAVRKVMESER